MDTLFNARSLGTPNVLAIIGILSYLLLSENEVLHNMSVDNIYTCLGECVIHETGRHLYTRTFIYVLNFNLYCL